MRRALGLDDPAVLQFMRFLGAALSGDLGVSYRFGMPVGKLLMERLPATLELSLCAMLVATALGIPLGVWTALHRRSVWSHVLLFVSLVGVALPTFLIGIVLILIFSVWLGWLPSFGRGATVTIAGSWTTGLLTASGLRALVLPSLTLGLFQMTLIMRLVRAEMLEVPRARPPACDSQLRSCAAQHAGPGHHHRRAAVRQHLCLLDHRRDGVPVAGPRPSCHPVDTVRRRAVARLLPGLDRVRVRDHQPCGRSALRRR